MSTKLVIGHASINENGEPTGGSPGDQSNREVCIREDYDLSYLNPDFVLRPKSDYIAYYSVQACIAGCNNNNIGYDCGIPERNTLYEEAVKVNFDLSKISVPCTTDCSAFMTVCAIAGGAKIPYGQNAPSTSSMKNVFFSSGYYEVLTDKKHLTNSDYLKYGDILVKANSHTVMVLASGAAIGDDSGIDLTADDDEITASSDQIKQVVEATTLSLKITDKTATTAKVTCTVSTIKGDTKTTLKKADDLKKYTFKYELRTLNNASAKPTTKAITVNSDSVSFTLDGLKPYNVYMVSVTATKTKEKQTTTSAGSIFSTELTGPTAVKNLSVTLPKVIKENSVCTLKFDAPESFCNEASAIASKGYRVCLVINGKVIAHSDNLISAGATSPTKKFKLNELNSKLKLNATDIIQIGVQTWVKYKNDIIKFNANFPKCSKTFISEQPAKEPFKIFLKTDDGFRPVLIYKVK